MDPTTKLQKFYGLDHLRALAISYVFLFHYFILSDGRPEWLPAFAAFGWSGVDLFFVLSGFLISSQLFQEVKKGRAISFRIFFLKRFFRIIPSYLFTVGLYFMVPWFREKNDLPPLWKFVTFTQNFGLDLKEAGAFSHAWSLCVEEHFYFFLPLILIALQLSRFWKQSYWILIILFAGGFVLRAYSYHYLYSPHAYQGDGWVYWYRYVYYPTYNRLDGLLTGVSVAALYHFLPNIWRKLSGYGNWFLGAGITILAGAAFLCSDQQAFAASVYGYPLVSIGYGCVVAAAVSPACFLYRWRSKLTTFIATLSFGIYLTHKGIIHLVHQLLKETVLSDSQILIVSIAGCVLVAYLLNLMVEKPFLRLRQKVVRQP